MVDTTDPEAPEAPDAEMVPADEGDSEDMSEDGEFAAIHIPDLPDQDRSLSGTELARESTRLAVGAVGMLGTGMRRMIERFGVPEDQLSDADESDKHETEGPLSAARTTFVGMVFETQHNVAETAGRARSAINGATGQVGEAVSMLEGTPVVGDATKRVRETLGRWHETGQRESGASREYATLTLGRTMKYSLDFIVEGLDVQRIADRLDINNIIQNLELTNVIVDSTGGITGAALDAVRAQAVGADSFVERIVNRMLRRKTHDDLAEKTEPDQVIDAGEAVPIDQTGETDAGEEPPQ